MPNMPPNQREPRDTGCAPRMTVFILFVENEAIFPNELLESNADEVFYDPTPLSYGFDDTVEWVSVDVTSGEIYP